MKRCKVCRQPFQPMQPMAVVCSLDCALTLAKSKNAKAAKVARVKERREDKARKERLKTRSQWVRECQAAVNRWARLRDILAGHGCISCGEPYRGAYGGAFDAGHYRSVGSAPHLRFNLHQIHLQCHKCNRYLGGNAVAFRAGLVARRGLQFVEGIESMGGSPKWSVDYLRRLKAVATKRGRRLQKRVEAVHV